MDGRKLTEFELFGFCSLLLVSGNETTTNLIGNTLFRFKDFPEVPKHLRNHHPDDIKKAIEEVLRHRSMVRSLERIAVSDVELNGQIIKKGQLVHVWLGSANQDQNNLMHWKVLKICRLHLQVHMKPFEMKWII